MDYSMPRLLVPHYLLEFAQVQVHWIGDATNHLILCHRGCLLPSPFAFSLCQHRCLFQWAGSWHQMPKLLKLQQHESFQWVFRVDFLSGWLVWSPCCPRDSQESSPVPQFENISSSVLKLLYGPTLTFIHDYWKTHSFVYMDLCQQSVTLDF